MASADPQRTHRAVKRPRAPSKSVTESMDSAAEKLWSAKTREFLEFEPIVQTNGLLPLGGIGVSAGPKGDAAFYSYIKQPVVIARLQAEGFERANQGALHPWFLIIKPGVVSPAEKALCRSLTSTQRARIEANRLDALVRRRLCDVCDEKALCRSLASTQREEDDDDDDDLEPEELGRRMHARGDAPPSPNAQNDRIRRGYDEAVQTAAAATAAANSPIAAPSSGAGPSSAAGGVDDTGGLNLGGAVAKEE